MRTWAGSSSFSSGGGTSNPLLMVEQSKRDIMLLGVSRGSGCFCDCPKTTPNRMRFRTCTCTNYLKRLRIYISTVTTVRSASNTLDSPANDRRRPSRACYASEVKLATEKELRQGETSHLHYQKTCLQAEKEDLQVRQRGGRPRSGVPYHGFNLKWFIGCC